VVATLPEEIQVLAREAYAIGLQRVFIFTAAVALLGFCIRLGIPELSLDTPQAETTDEDSEIAHSPDKPNDVELGRGEGVHGKDNSARPGTQTNAINALALRVR